MTNGRMMTSYGYEVDVDLSDVERLRKLHEIERVVKQYETEQLRELHGNEPTEDANEFKEFDDAEILGRTDGIEWAAKKAMPAQLRRLEELKSRSDAENVSWTSYAWGDLRDEEFLAKTILGLDEGRDTCSFELFWKQIGREYSIVRSRYYLNSFLQAAFDTWRVIQNHADFTDSESD